MRVIAGTYKSRILKSLKGLALRPTSDRLRETLFNVLAPNIAGSRFIDLFAGTGAVGIEALSRGAVEVVFIENHAPAVTLIRRNLESLGVRSGFQVLASDVVRGLEKLAPRKQRADQRFDCVFLDPPCASAKRKWADTGSRLEKFSPGNWEQSARYLQQIKCSKEFSD